MSNKEALEEFLSENTHKQLSSLLAEHYLQEKEVEKVLAICRENLAQNPTSAVDYYLMALANIKTDDNEAAIENLKLAVGYDSGFLEAYYKLLEIGRGTLSPGLMKSCYTMIARLNPYDTKAREERDKIDAEPITPAAPEPPVPYHPETKDVQKGEKLPETAVEDTEPEQEEEPQLSEIPAPEEKESEPSKMAEPEPEEQPVTQTESSGEEKTPPDSAPAESDIEKKVTAEPEKPVEEQATKTDDSADKMTRSPPASGETATRLSEMFQKLKTKPLDEVQKEDWSVPAAGEKEAEKQSPPQAAQNSGSKSDSVEKSESQPAKAKKDTKKEVSEDQASPAGADSTKVKKTGKSQPKPRNEKPTDAVLEEEQEEKSGEMKIPRPTMTLVQVYKQQKLYNEALQILDALEKTGDQDKIQKLRDEILQLKAQAEAEEEQ